MIALEPCEEWMMSASIGDRDENGQQLPDGLAWAMWGIIDGHAGSNTAIVVRELLPDYIIDELFLRAGIDPSSPHRDSRTIFQNCSLQDTIQAITDAFVRLDNDILKLATQAITGSKSFQASMQDFAPADSGCCALLAMYDAASRDLHVANVGDSRAVLGRRNAQGAWDAKPLSIDQTGYNEDEVARLQVEHPGEPEMIKDGRLLGLGVTRAFGDLRWKLSAKLQSIARSRFYPRALLPSLLSPPYLTAEPVITTTKIDPDNNDFVILASDGFWDHISSEQAVELVGRWLLRNDPAKTKKQEGTLDLDIINLAEEDEDESERTLNTMEGLRNGDIVRSPPQCSVRGREYTKTRHGDEKNWVVVDDNAATHLARNAMGGADEEMFCALAGSTALYPMRRLRYVLVLLKCCLHLLLLGKSCRGDDGA
ncbi:MAG: hypothetical protein Q9166_001862 [cf. Caloplaca sp. 2 TL-2023]